MSKIITTEMFVNRCLERFGDKYDYSLVKYINNRTKVKIICTIHGVFEKTPHDLIISDGCQKCSNKSKITKNVFVEKSIKKYGKKFNYDKVDYKNNKTKVTLYCNDCKNCFDVRPDNHLNKNDNCPFCSGKKLTKNYFIKQAKEVHNNKYDYSLVDYKNNRTNVKIICPEHGIFTQTPNSHLSKKRGCPMCKYSTGEKEIIRILENKNINYIKEKSFIDCRNKLPLPFDFYLPEYNLCIEFDGQQHFESIKCFGGEKRFKETQKHDKIKNKYCEDNNIKLLRIKYNENVEKTINMFLLFYI